jgi:hypothetical protein
MGLDVSRGSPAFPERYWAGYWVTATVAVSRVPRGPTGKRVQRDDGTFIVVNKAGNRAGKVFFVPERRVTRLDGRVQIRRAHWRATYVEPVSGRQRTVQAPTRDEVTRRRDRALRQS